VNQAKMPETEIIALDKFRKKKPLNNNPH